MTASLACLLGPWAGGVVLILAGGIAGALRVGYLARRGRRTSLLPLVLLLCNGVLFWDALQGFLELNRFLEVRWSESILMVETAPFGIFPWLAGAALSRHVPAVLSLAGPFLYLVGYCVALFGFVAGPHKAAWRVAALIPLVVSGILAIEGKDVYDTRHAELARRTVLQKEIAARPAFRLPLDADAHSHPARLGEPASFTVSATPVPIVGYSPPLGRLAGSFSSVCVAVPDETRSIFPFTRLAPAAGSPVCLLLETKADLVLVAGEDKDDARLATDAGKELTFTPVARDALVFFTRADNSVKDITAEQARAVYSGTIRNWKELGGNDEPIKPFQHADTGYAQNRALQAFMGGTPVLEPEKHTVVWMDSVGFRNEWLEIVPYDNTPGAIGYALRVSLIHPEGPPSGIKVLSLDGVLPTPEAIRNGVYPAILPILAVTLREKLSNPKVSGYIDWMLSSQGQQLLEKCGLMTGPRVWTEHNPAK